MFVLEPGRVQFELGMNGTITLLQVVKKELMFSIACLYESIFIAFGQEDMESPRRKVLA